MPDAHEVDLRAAVNAISDVIQNRPRPLRLFDQIYMKAGDMVLQSELVARWADGKKLAFIGDGDAISVCAAYMRARGILEYGPSEVVVFDFDERVCNAVKRFAEKERVNTLDARLYNCLEALPAPGGFDLFYTNPPWGSNNGGESVCVFTQRGMESVGHRGEGMVVVADDADLGWPAEVSVRLQRFALDRGYFVHKMMPSVHSYHVDDAPGLRSCNIVLRPVPGAPPMEPAGDISDPLRLENFYGRAATPRVRYVREGPRCSDGRAGDGEYTFEIME